MYFCTCTGPGLALKGAVFPNHGVINKDPSVIGEDEDALYCVTDDVTCCGTQPSPDCCGNITTVIGDGGSGNGRGDWESPIYSLLDSGTNNSYVWYVRWLTGAALMNFRGTATTDSTAEAGTTGLYRCDIRDSTGTLHLFYTCIYAEIGSPCKSVTCYTGTQYQFYTCMQHCCLSIAMSVCIIYYPSVLSENAAVVEIT